ncbi:hypothetical protein VNO77_17307 [Canavalia gladiata]|uniref:Transmembrane protein n=1 Tax=Canavalia gladiata TaxID=3824 RepID=A0AAN9LIM9_CANGL
MFTSKQCLYLVGCQHERNWPFCVGRFSKWKMTIQDHLNMYKIPRPSLAVAVLMGLLFKAFVLFVVHLKTRCVFRIRCDAHLGPCYTYRTYRAVEPFHYAYSS